MEATRKTIRDEIEKTSFDRRGEKEKKFEGREKHHTQTRYDRQFVCLLFVVYRFRDRKGEHGGGMGAHQKEPELGRKI